MPDLDHLVYVTPDLAASVEHFTQATGVRPTAGGRHLSRGSANYLVSLDFADRPAAVPGAYLEIAGPDPDQPEHAGTALFGLDALRAPALVTWAIRAPDLDAAIAAARVAGDDPGEGAALSRSRPDGSVLSWRLTDARLDDGGVLPFLIDWGAGEHPTSAALPRVTVRELFVQHPDPALITARLGRLGAGGLIEVRAGRPAGLQLTVAGPGGELRLA